MIVGVRGGLVIRLLIIFFWTSVIVFFLFLPKFFNFFGAEKSLTIFTWPLVLDAHYLARFEKETGIKLYIGYYETDDELIGKIKSGSGNYDIVIPTDHVVELLIREKLLKKLNKSKLNFLPSLDSRLLGHYFDPHNAYSIPYFWGVYGIAINTYYFNKKTPEPTWGLLFDKSMSPAPVVMTDAAREAIMIAAQYLFGTIEALKDPQKRKQIKKMLIKQKKWVQLYTESRTEELLLLDSAPVIAALSPDVWKAKQEKKNNLIEFLIPKEGSFIFIDNFVVLASTQKDDLVYTFLNYMYRPEVVVHHMAEYGSCAPITGIPADSSNYCPKNFSKFDFFRNVISEQEVDSIWIDLMAH